MSGLGPKRTFSACERHVRFGPKADIIAVVRFTSNCRHNITMMPHSAPSPSLASNTDAPHKKSRHHVVNCTARRHDGGSSAAGAGHVYYSRTDGGGPGVSPC